MSWFMDHAKTSHNASYVAVPQISLFLIIEKTSLVSAAEPVPMMLFHAITTIESWCEYSPPSPWKPKGMVFFSAAAERDFNSG